MGEISEPRKPWIANFGIAFVASLLAIRYLLLEGTLLNTIGKFTAWWQLYVAAIWTVSLLIINRKSIANQFVKPAALAVAYLATAWFGACANIPLPTLLLIGTVMNLTALLVSGQRNSLLLGLACVNTLVATQEIALSIGLWLMVISLTLTCVSLMMKPQSDSRLQLTT